MSSQMQKTILIIAAAFSLLTFHNLSAQADQRSSQYSHQQQFAQNQYGDQQYGDQGGQGQPYEGYGEGQGPEGQPQFGDNDNGEQYSDDQGYYDPSPRQQQQYRQGQPRNQQGRPPQQYQQLPPQQEIELPPNYQQPNYQPPFRRPGFQYRNYQVPMESTLYCYRPNCAQRPPPVLPYPGPQVRVMPFPYRVQAQAFCQIRPLPGGLSDIVFNGSVLLYRGFGPNVQAAIWHYRNTGICRNFF